MEKEELKAIKQNSLTYNGIMNLVYSGSKVIFPLITAPYLSRILGAESTGRVDFIFSVANYFVLIAGLGIPTYGIKACAKAKNNKTELTIVTQELLCINIIALIISLCCYLVCIISTPKLYKELPIAIIGGFYIIAKTFSIDWFYQGIEQYDYIVKRTLLLRCVTLLFILLSISSPKDYLMYACSCMLAEAGVSIFNFYNLKQYISLLPNVNAYHLKKHFKSVMVFFTASIAISVYNQIDVTMIGWIKNASETGFYEYGIKPVKIIWTILIGLTTVALPRAVSYVGQYKNEHNLRINLAQFIFIIATALTWYFYSVSEDIILLLFGTEYAISVEVFRIFVFSIFPVAYSNYFVNVIIIPYGNEKKRTISVVIGLIVDIILNAMLIPQYGALGAAFSTLCTEIVVCFCLALFVKNALRDIIANFCLVKKMLFLFGCIVLSLFIRNMHISSIFSKLLLSTVIFFSGCVIMIYLFKEQVVMDQLGKLKTTIKEYKH